MDIILLDHIQAEVTKEDVLRKFGMPPDHKLGPDIEKAIDCQCQASLRRSKN